MRMRPLTDDKPKPLVEVAGQPLLAHVLAVLPHVFDELIVVVKYRGDQIREYLGSEYRGVPVRYVEQDMPDGTGGALFAAKPYLEDRFMVLPADDLHGASALAKLATHPLAILATHTDTPELFGTLTLNKGGTLSGIEEKPTHPQTTLVSISVMVLDTRIFSYTVPCVGEELLLTDMVTAFAADAPG